MGTVVENFVDRRSTPRRDVQASVRNAGEAAGERWHTTRDISAGGMRMLYDRALSKGELLALEMLLPDGSWLPLRAKVAWSVKLDIGAPAEYEVGLRFLDLTTADHRRLAALLPAPPGVHADGGKRDS